MLLMLACLASGCSNSVNSSFTSLFGGQITPPVDGTLGAGGSGVASTGTTLTTTTGGYIEVTSVSQLTLNSNQTFYGLAADPNNLYQLLKENDGGGIYHWLFMSMPNSSNTFSTVCSILDDGNFSGGLGWDGTYFYTFKPGGPPIYIRRFQASNCSEATALDTNFNQSSTIGGFISLDSGTLYWEPTSTPLYVNTASSGAEVATFSGSSTIGTKTFNFGALGYSYPFTVKSGTLWALGTDPSTSDILLWKFTVSTSTVTPIGWVDINSIAQSYALSNITTQDGSTLVIESGSGTAVSLYSVNVSHF